MQKLFIDSVNIILILVRLLLKLLLWLLTLCLILIFIFFLKLLYFFNQSHDILKGLKDLFLGAHNDIDSFDLAEFLAEDLSLDHGLQDHLDSPILSLLFHDIFNPFLKLL